MKIPLHTIVLGTILLFVLIFAGLNWAAFSEPVALSLLVTTISAPVGLVMLGVVGVLTVVYGVVITTQQTKLLLETGRAAKELQKVRALADKAEESRFQKVMEYMQEELPAIRELLGLQLEQSEAAAVDLAGTVLGETEGLQKRLASVEDEIREPSSE